MSMTKVALATALLLASSAAFAQPAAVAAAPLAISVTSDLPRTARPSHYAIEIEPDANTLTFRGIAAIDLEIFEPTGEIVLHANGLTISRATANRNAEHGLTRLTATLDPEKQLVRLTTGTL